MTEQEEFEFRARRDKESSAPKESFGEKTLRLVEPTIEALGTAGGAMLGAPLGPPGVVGGAGLGYGITKEALGGIKRMAGYEPPRTGAQKVTEPIRNIVEGATFEAGGRALPEVLKGAGKLGSSLGEILTTSGQSRASKRAAKIASEALGTNLGEARQILKGAADDITASQALALINPETGRAVLTAPTAQALLKRAEARDANFYIKLFGEQDAARIKQLEQIAGGSNQTAARQAREQLKTELNERLIPTLKTELEAANIAGKQKPRLAGEAQRMEDAAAQKVGDVRRFTAAQPRAEEMARSRLIQEGKPVGAVKYTYVGGDLQKRAEQVALDAAEGSLRFGDAARFARAAEQSLEAHGLRPLTGESVVASITGKLRDPQFAGNADIRNSLINVAKDIRQWTTKGGVIDAFALDSIRKNSVNATIQKMYPAASKQEQKALASKVLESIKPTIIDSIESAGGTGYRQYLTDYALGSQKIAQTKLGGELLGLYQTSPKDFVRWVEGNAPQEIEKVFGPGSYNIFKEMSVSVQQRLGKISGELQRDVVASEQAIKGEKTLADILKTNLDFFRLPHWLSKGTTLTNDMISRLEDRVSKDTLQALTDAAKSAKSFDELLSLIPDKNKQEVVKVLATSPTAGGVIAGADQDKKRR
jgi:hypothetical protein